MCSSDLCVALCGVLGWSPAISGHGWCARSDLFLAVQLRRELVHAGEICSGIPNKAVASSYPDGEADAPLEWEGSSLLGAPWWSSSTPSCNRCSNKSFVPSTPLRAYHLSMPPPSRGRSGESDGGLLPLAAPVKSLRATLHQAMGW